MGAQVRQWPPGEVQRLKHNLRELREVVENGKFDSEVRGLLARLLIIRSAGYIEQAVAECCREHVRAKAGGWVRSFAHSWLERSKNPKPRNLVELIGRFDASAAQQFESTLDADDQRVARELHSLMDKRNKIAHGLNEGVTPRTALQLEQTAEEVVDWFILWFNPDRPNHTTVRI